MAEILSSPSITWCRRWKVMWFANKREDTETLVTLSSSLYFHFFSSIALGMITVSIFSYLITCLWYAPLKFYTTIAIYLLFPPLFPPALPQKFYEDVMSYDIKGWLKIWWFYVFFNQLYIWVYWVVGSLYVWMILRLAIIKTHKLTKWESEGSWIFYFLKKNLVDWLTTCQPVSGWLSIKVRELHL